MSPTLTCTIKYEVALLIKRKKKSASMALSFHGLLCLTAVTPLRKERYPKYNTQVFLMIQLTSLACSTYTPARQQMQTFTIKGREWPQSRHVFHTHTVTVKPPIPISDRRSDPRVPLSEDTGSSRDDQCILGGFLTHTHSPLLSGQPDDLRLRRLGLALVIRADMCDSQALLLAKS